MLVSGVVLRPRERYRIFAEGLIGGGWAGLYFTTFAMHGLEAARVIASPRMGTLLLLSVAVGMVAAGLELGVPEYRFVRRYVERLAQPPVTLRQVDPLIRELTHYRDYINALTKGEET